MAFRAGVESCDRPGPVERDPYRARPSRCSAGVRLAAQASDAHRCRHRAPRSRRTVPEPGRSSVPDHPGSARRDRHSGREVAQVPVRVGDTEPRPRDTVDFARRSAACVGTGVAAAGRRSSSPESRRARSAPPAAQLSPASHARTRESRRFLRGLRAVTVGASTSSPRSASRAANQREMSSVAGMRGVRLEMGCPHHDAPAPSRPAEGRIHLTSEA